MRLRWTASAEKRGYDRLDVIHAMGEGRIGAVREFQDSRIEGGAKPWLFVGWDRDGQELIEVMAFVDGEAFVVFHVMPARQKHIDQVRRAK